MLLLSGREERLDLVGNGPLDHLVREYRVLCLLE
jgi:hypothetical protein